MTIYRIILLTEDFVETWYPPALTLKHILGPPLWMRAWFWNYWGVLMDGLALHPPLGIFPDNTRHFYCLFIPAKESRKLLSWALGAAKTRLLLLKCSTVMGTSTPRNLLYHSSPSYLHLFTGETFSFYCINKRFPTCGSKVSEIVLSQDCLRENYLRIHSASEQRSQAPKPH